MAGWGNAALKIAEQNPDVEIVEEQRQTPTAARKQYDAAQRESLSRLFLAHWQRWELPTLTPEHRFHDTRKWRLDYALIPQKIAIEIHGGTRKTYTDKNGVVRQGGRHNRAQGFANDREKMNAAQAMGWTVFELTDVMLKDRDAMDAQLQLIKERIGE